MRRTPIAQIGEIRQQLEGLRTTVGARVYKSDIPADKFADEVRRKRKIVIGLFEVAGFHLNELDELKDVGTVRYLIESFTDIMYDIKKATWPLAGKEDESVLKFNFIIRAFGSLAASKVIVPLTAEQNPELMAFPEAQTGITGKVRPAGSSRYYTRVRGHFRRYPTEEEMWAEMNPELRAFNDAQTGITGKVRPAGSSKYYTRVRGHYRRYPDEEMMYEGNPMSRETLMKEIRKIMGDDWHLRPSEEFGASGSGGIWTDGESSGKDGQMLANYNGPDNTGMGFWMHPRIKTLLDRAGWYLEWYDPGTIMIYKI